MIQQDQQQRDVVVCRPKKKYSPPRLMKMGDVAKLTLGNSGGPYCDMNYGTRNGNGNGNGGGLCS